MSRIEIRDGPEAWWGVADSIRASVRAVATWPFFSTRSIVAVGCGERLVGGGGAPQGRGAARFTHHVRQDDLEGGG